MRKFMNPTSPIAALQIAWVIERVLPYLPGKVSLHTLMTLEAAKDVMRTGDLEHAQFLMDDIRRGCKLFEDWQWVMDPPSPKELVYPKLVWCVGRKTPAGRVDWQFGGRLKGRDSLRLFTNHGHKYMTTCLFERRVTADSYVWRHDGFPLEVALGAIDVSNEPQPFGVVRMATAHEMNDGVSHSLMPVWCAACDCWVNDHAPYPCDHIGYCAANGVVTSLEQNIRLNRKGALSPLCKRSFCVPCSTLLAKTAAVADDYKPNRGVGKAFQ